MNAIPAQLSQGLLSARHCEAEHSNSREFNNGIFLSFAESIAKWLSTTLQVIIMIIKGLHII